MDRTKEVLGIIKPIFAVDIFVYTPEEFSEMLSKENPFLQHALEEGEVIYEKS